jgi:predicted kinase
MNRAKVHTNKPLLILLYGFPGAGKTHFSRNMTEHLESAHVHGDKIRNELFEEPRFDKQENSIIKHLMDYMAEEFLTAGVSVVYDTNMMRKADRHVMRELARKKGAKTLLVWFQIDADTAFKRLGTRDRRTADDKYAVEYSQQDFREYASMMQHPEPTEDYVVVSGKHTFGSQKNAVFKKLIESGHIDPMQGQSKVAMPGLINLVPNSMKGRVDMSRRNIRIN